MTRKGIFSLVQVFFEAKWEELREVGIGLDIMQVFDAVSKSNSNNLWNVNQIQ